MPILIECLPGARRDAPAERHTTSRLQTRCVQVSYLAQRPGGWLGGSNSPREVGSSSRGPDWLVRPPRSLPVYHVPHFACTFSSNPSEPRVPPKRITLGVACSRRGSRNISQDARNRVTSGRI